MESKNIKCRKTYKIETVDKAECVVLCLDHGATRAQVMDWFGICERTVTTYLRIMGKSNPVGRPRSVG